MVGAASEGEEPATGLSAAEIESLRREVERLKAERAELQAQLASRAARGGHHRLRRSMAAVLAGTCCVLIFLSALTVWIHQTVISTSGFVATVGPIIDRPAVSQTMSVELTNQIFGVIDVEREVKQILPSQGQFLAGPLANAAQGFVQGQVLNVLRSPQFRTLWTTVLQATHREVIAALRGQSSALTVSNGAVVLNVLPLLDVAMQQVQSLASGLLGRNVTIPKITSTEIPSQVRDTLSKALGVQLPADFGQIELARSSSLDVAKNSVQLLDVLFWLLPLLTLLVIAAALWLSTNRRRTLLQILVGTAVALIVEKRAESWIQSRIIASLDPANRAAGGDVIHQVLSGLITATWWVLIIALVAVVVLLLTGPYRWARTLHGQVAYVADGFARAVARRTGDQATVAWVVDHRRAMQAAGAVVGGLLLLVAPGWWFFVVAVVLAAYEVALWRAGSARTETGGGASVARPPTETPGAGPVGTVG